MNRKIVIGAIKTGKICGFFTYGVICTVIFVYNATEQ